ncbi:MAG: hypothetical protein HZB51_13105 [Chloroflexi bacterium]|nr:hypothetical protein [Chloroflexota bacterium]
MKKERFSINWGKGTFVALLVVALVLIVWVANLIQTANSTSVAVDWRSRPTPVCPSTDPKCQVAVDWGSFTAPCLPTDPKCGSGPLAVDWGSSIYPCLPSDLKCRLGPVAVDWGSKTPRP